MRTLQETIDRMNNKGGAASSLRKHLSAEGVGIYDWEDLTRSKLYDLKDHLSKTVSIGTQKTVMANLRSIMNRVKDEVKFPDDFATIMNVKPDSPRATYLTLEELRAFEAVETKNKTEKIVQVESLIEAFTGARLSDVMTFTEENFSEGYLIYTAQKTKKTATVPLSEKTKGWIRYAQENRGDEPCLMQRGRIIKRLAKRAGITKTVKTRRGSVDKVTEKWEVLSSHSMRRSCATNLVMAGASLTDAKLCMGHSNESMTSRYVVATVPNLSAAAMKYFL